MDKIEYSKSYMDELLPEEINIELVPDQNEQDMSLLDLEEYYYDFEQYCVATKICSKWRKNKVGHIEVLSKNQKCKFNDVTLKEYYLSLKNYYIKTKDLYKFSDLRKLSDKEYKQLSSKEKRMYLKDLRNCYSKSKIDNMSLSSRKKIYPYLRKIFSLSRIASGVKVYKLNDELPKLPDGRPVIFTITHSGKDDIAVFNEVINRHFTILSGDFESLHSNIEGLVSRLAHTMFFDMNSPKERQNIQNSVVDVLNNGDDILCSMEGAWNITANVIVQDLFKGMITCALKSNAVIIPIGIERFEKKLYGVNVSDVYFDPIKYKEQYEDDEEMYKIAIEDLKNLMAEKKYELYFCPQISKKITVSRKSIGDYDEYYEKFKNDILEDWTFTEEIIRKKSFRNKNNPIYAFEYVKKQYEDIFLLYDKIQSERISQFEKTQILKVLKEKLVRLASDVNNPIYPNEVHNYLEKLLFDIQQKDASNQQFIIKRR